MIEETVEKAEMITIKRIFLLSIALITSILAQAQPAFNYDNIAICEGDSYDLLKYQHNEVITPVGWEIIGWQGVSNTTVTPTVSPAVYTLEYREKANPGVVFTKDFTITLHPKPTVSITPNGQQTLCEGDPIHIEQVSATNYDKLFWLHVETGTRYETNEINAAANLDNGNRMTYKLLATNKNCPAFLAQDQMMYSVVENDANKDYVTGFTTNRQTNTNNGTIRGYDYNYCADVKLNDYVALQHVICDLGVFGRKELALNGESEFLKVTRFEIVWDNPDAYTTGAPLHEQNYYNSFTIVAEVYIKGCGRTKTYTEKRYIQLNHGCEGNLELKYVCSKVTGKGDITLNYINIGRDDILDVTFENKTLAGKYIPVQIEYIAGNTNFGFTRYYAVTWDEDAPQFLVYDVSVTYKAADGSIITQKITDFGVESCLLETGLYYYFRDNTGSFISFTKLPPGCGSYACTNYTTDPPIATVTNQICQYNSTNILLSTPQGNGWIEVVWDNQDFGYTTYPIPTQQNGIPLAPSEYQNTVVNGKLTQRLKQGLFNSAGGATFMMMPKETTTYTGTVYGIPFALRVDVKEVDLAVRDTAICKGESIDLKTLENTANVDGLVTWAVGDETLVSPLVSTAYLLYGIPKFPCPASDAGKTLEQYVIVRVDSPIWTSKESPTVCKGDQVTLSDHLNTNTGAQITWYDDLNNVVPFGVATADAPAAFRVEIKNACETVNETLFVDVDNACPPPGSMAALNDTAHVSACSNVPSREVKIPVLENDIIPTQKPFVSIVTPPSLSGNSASMKNDSIVYTATFYNTSFTGTIRDSVQYEVDANGQKKRAWVYIDIEKYELPVIESHYFSENDLFVQVSGGTTPYTYVLNDEITSPYPAFANVGKGDHDIKVTDANGCFTSLYFYKGSPFLQANNDTLKFTICGTSSAIAQIDVLANDSIPCDPLLDALLGNLSVNVLYSSFPSYSILNLIVNKNQLRINYSLTDSDIDSLQYEVICNSERDTAWVYFISEKKETKILSFTASASEVSIKTDMENKADIIRYYLTKEDLSIDLNSGKTDTAAYTFENLTLTDGKYYIDACQSNCCAADSFELKNGQLVIPPPSTYPDNVIDIDCYTTAKPTQWGIRYSESLVGYAYYSTPVVGDLDNDGLPEITGSRDDYRNFHMNIDIYKGGDHTQINSSLSTSGGTSGGYSPQSVAIARIPSRNNPADTLGMLFRFTMDKNYVQRRLTSFIYNDINDVQEFKTRTLEVLGSSYNSGVPAVADFNQDGHPEVYIGNQVFDAYTLEKIGSLPAENHGLKDTHDSDAAMSSAADVLPGNPGLELLCGNQIFAVNPDAKPNGVTLLQTMGTRSDGAAQAADINGDGKLEIVVSTGDYVLIYSPETNNSFFSTAFTGYPTIGDIDGCGLPEIIGLINNSEMAAYKYNTATNTMYEFWKISHSDVSSLTGMTIFDFNQDGIKEIVYRDQSYLRLINGSGKSHFTMQDTLQAGKPVVYNLARINIGSPTKDEYPVIADIDADNEAEIIVSGIINGITSWHIFKSDGDPWAPARPVWNQYQYDVVNVNKDLTIPQYQFDKTTVMPNGKRMFNNFLEQATLLNQNGDPYSYASTDTTRISETITVGEGYNKNGFIIPIQTQPALVKDTLYLKNQTLCDSLVVLNLTVKAPVILPNVELKNDTIYAGCSTLNFKIPLLDNAVYTCTTPALSLLTPFTLGGNSAAIAADTLYIGIAANFTALARDSIEYEMDCDGVKDTAWVHVYIDRLESTAAVAGSFCAGESYNFFGSMLNTPGTYYHTLTGTNGCDSIITLNLSMANPVSHTFTAAICEGESYEFEGKILYNHGDTHTHTYTSSQGCDSVVTAQLAVEKNFESVVYHSISNGSFVTIDGVKYYAPTEFSNVYTTVSGCDSIVTYIINWDLSGCAGTDPVPDKYFSPNGDGINDVWKITNIECFDHVIDIYDRFGKRLMRYENNFFPWDGMYNNHQQPSTDYWYVIKYNNKQLVGHFTLKR